MTTKLIGIAAAPGLARGRLAVWGRRALDVPRFHPADPDAERQRLASARLVAASHLLLLARDVEARAGAEEAALFETHAVS